MKIIKRIEDNVVLYAGEDLRLDDTGAFGPVDEATCDFAWHDPALNPENAQLLDVDELPANFSGGCYTHVDGAWISTDALDAQLQQLRDAKWVEIKAIRDRLQDEGGYKVAIAGVDKWFHSDVKSRTQQIGLTMMGAAVPPVPWKTMDGSFVNMSQAIASAIFAAAAAQDMALFAHAEQLRAQVNAGDPSSIDISAGWPATFEG